MSPIPGRDKIDPGSGPPCYDPSPPDTPPPTNAVNMAVLNGRLDGGSHALSYYDSSTLEKATSLMQEAEFALPLLKPAFCDLSFSCEQMQLYSRGRSELCLLLDSASEVLKTESDLALDLNISLGSYALGSEPDDCLERLFNGYIPEKAPQHDDNGKMYPPPLQRKGPIRYIGLYPRSSDPPLSSLKENSRTQIDHNAHISFNHSALSCFSSISYLFTLISRLVAKAYLALVPKKKPWDYSQKSSVNSEEAKMEQIFNDLENCYYDDSFWDVNSEEGLNYIIAQPRIYQSSFPREGVYPAHEQGHLQLPQESNTIPNPDEMEIDDDFLEQFFDFSNTESRPEEFSSPPTPYSPADFTLFSPSFSQEPSPPPEIIYTSSATASPAGTQPSTPTSPLRSPSFFESSPETATVHGYRCSNEACSTRPPFERRCDLNKHLKTHMKFIMCPHTSCIFKCSTAKDLKRHNDTVHLKLREFVCTKCVSQGLKGTFSRKDNLQDHQRRVHGIGKRKK
ncbi:hypothetical protein BDZ91DRAFT_714385 [Kalaharituber pfeilii]|nr:hypothetical protein BDZ91DRAFT_714385 [Kalaharituber pfeilii]